MTQENFYIVYCSSSDAGSNNHWYNSDYFDCAMSNICWDNFSVIATGQESKINENELFLIVIFDSDKENINVEYINKILKHDPSTQILLYPSMKLIEWESYHFNPQKRT